MKIYCQGPNGECETCVNGMDDDEPIDISIMWRKLPQAFDCSICGVASMEWELNVHDVVLPFPDMERTPNQDEFRKLGWGLPDDDTCSTCGLHTFDGDYPLCEECDNCNDCSEGQAQGVCAECRKLGDDGSIVLK